MSKFILTEGSRLDIEPLIRITSEALKSFVIWKQLWNDVPVEDELEWLRLAFATRYTMNDMSLFVIIEETTKYRSTGLYRRIESIDARVGKS